MNSFTLLWKQTLIRELVVLLVSMAQLTLLKDVIYITFIHLDTVIQSDLKRRKEFMLSM